MDAFERIIGYGSIKEELRQLCDMIHHMDVYDRLGAKMPKGLLLHGEPGVGKSLMAQSFIQESGRKSYILRRNRPDGDFVHEIRKVFMEAARHAPAVILLDDMDKFVVEEKNSEEYVAVQACIDEVKGADVYVVATANNLRGIPDSLLRAGRFDRRIYVEPPKGDDAVEIVRYYLSTKAVDSGLCVDDIAKMLSGKSCADLETLLNEAAIYAGYERKDKITMDHIVRSVLRNEYGVSDAGLSVDSSCMESVAYHEAGHTVVSELLQPGSVGLASLRTRVGSERGGFVISCVANRSPSQDVLISLAGNAATEIILGMVSEGASRDFHRAIDTVTESVTKNAICGFSTVDIFEYYENPSDSIRARQEAMIQAEVERYAMQAKKLLSENRTFLASVATALLEKETLLHSDIQRIREASQRASMTSQL